MLRRIGKLFIGALCAGLNLHTAEDLREAQKATDNLYLSDLRARNEEIDGLRADLAHALESQTGKAVEECDCPRCNAPAGERCHDMDGKPLRRTHRERTSAWREMPPKEMPS